MMVGHAMLAFVLVAVAARLLGRERTSALALGVTAAMFAALPDVDMAYALLGATQVQVADAWAVTEAFWRSSQAVHRSITHSLVVAIPAALAFAWSVAQANANEGLANANNARASTDGGQTNVKGWIANVLGRLTNDASGFSLPGSRRSLSSWQIAALCLLVALVGVAFLESGPLGGAIMSVFAVSGILLAHLARVRGGLSERAVFATALVGLCSHPFGDLFTGSPPHLLYPLDVAVFESRVALAADPTLNLLAIFGLELATLWFAAMTFVGLTDRRLLDHVDARASLGAAYGVAALVLPAPTLSVSYHFVFSVLAVGAVGVTPRRLPATRLRWLRPSVLSRPSLSRPSLSRLSLSRPDATWTLRAALTGLAAVTFGALAYAFGYALSQGFLG